MSRSAVKIQERSRIDLRHDEVDGHFLTGEKNEDLELLKEVLVGVLGDLEQCRRQKSRVGAVE